MADPLAVTFAGDSQEPEEPRLTRETLMAKLNVNPEYQAALLDAESESWDGPGIDGSAMIEAARAKRRARKAACDG